MINTVDVRTSADQILMLERSALDRWGKGDPGGFLELYAADITYFDPLSAARIDGHQAMERRGIWNEAPSCAIVDAGRLRLNARFRLHSGSRVDRKGGSDFGRDLAFAH
jgi:hypothetical protein